MALLWIPKLRNGLKPSQQDSPPKLAKCQHSKTDPEAFARSIQNQQNNGKRCRRTKSVVFGRSKVRFFDQNDPAWIQESTDVSELSSSTEDFKEKKNKKKSPPPSPSVQEEFEHEELRRRDSSPKPSAVTKGEIQQVVKLVGKIQREKWSRPFEMLYLGETLMMTDETIVKRMSSSTFVGKVSTIEGQKELQGVVIHRRSFTVKNLLMRSPRNLQCSCYLNNIIEFIYKHLSRSAHQKTNFEWHKLRNMRLSASRETNTDK
mmetsp:Transcript_26482/g.42557  ORF Transcript_26482/g.42557 Transcript_26482/m.42557 type:complete len:261 (+) Transcript_26482:75-857(+)